MLVGAQSAVDCGCRQRTEILVLNGLARLSLGLDHIVPLFGKVLNEHLLDMGLVGARGMTMERVWRTVAIAITKVALFEHCTMSSSS